MSDEQKKKTRVLRKPTPWANIHRCLGPSVLDDNGKPTMGRLYCGHDKTTAMHVAWEESQRQGGIEVDVDCPKCGQVTKVLRRPPRPGIPFITCWGPQVLGGEDKKTPTGRRAGCGNNILPQYLEALEESKKQEGKPVTYACPVCGTEYPVPAVAEVEG